MKLCEKSELFCKTIEGVCEAFGVDLEVEEDPHHESKYTFLLKENGLEVRIGIEDFNI